MVGDSGFVAMAGKSSIEKRQRLGVRCFRGRKGLIGKGVITQIGNNPRLVSVCWADSVAFPKAKGSIANLQDLSRFLLPEAQTKSFFLEVFA